MINLIWKENKELVPYQDALIFMEDYVEQIKLRNKYSLVWFLEHPPIYTKGASASNNDLLEEIFPVYQSDRGGKFTYHGPGQRVIYVLIDLKKFFHPAKPDIRKFVFFLENWVIAALDKIGIKAFIKKDKIGIWVKDKGEDKKIGSIGIKVRSWISFHGIAININPNLEHFKGIIPCGITDYGIVSAQKLGYSLNAIDFDFLMKDSFYKIYQDIITDENNY